jgi:hypothetical protein
MAGINGDFLNTGLFCHWEVNKEHSKPSVEHWLAYNKVGSLQTG